MKRKIWKAKKRTKKIRPRKKHKGYLYDIDLVPIYRRYDKYSEEQTRVAYFNDWCVAQIGTTWDDAMQSFLEYRHGYPEIEECWQSLRKDFYDWAAGYKISGWGVHLYPDKD